MSSGSEDDFLSADEGSDEELSDSHEMTRSGNIISEDTDHKFAGSEEKVLSSSSRNDFEILKSHIPDNSHTTNDSDVGFVRTQNTTCSAVLKESIKKVDPSEFENSNISSADKEIVNIQDLSVASTEKEIRIRDPPVLSTEKEIIIQDPSVISTGREIVDIQKHSSVDNSTNVEIGGNLICSELPNESEFDIGEKCPSSLDLKESTAILKEPDELEKSSDQISSIENIEKNSKPKRILKESKIGIKKPRERLGDRLGSKKLGSRATKPLEGISYKSLMTEGSQVSSSNSDIVRTPPDEEVRKITTEIENVEESSEYTNQFDKANDSWNSWGNWGSSLISAASNISQEVSRSVGSVVENSLGIPSAEDYAREIVDSEKKLAEMVDKEDGESREKSDSCPDQTNKESSSNFGFGFDSLASIVNDVSGALGTASNTVLIGGLDTLELIGRKTMDVIKEKDPGLEGLKRKTNFLARKNENLSTILQEARLRAMETEDVCAGVDSDAIPEYEVHLRPLWVGSEWSPHYEALQLLSKQSLDSISSSLKSFSPIRQDSMQRKISEIKKFSEIEENDDIDDIWKEFTDLDAKINISFEKVKSSYRELESTVADICKKLQEPDIVISYSDSQVDLYKGIIPFVGNSIAIMHKTSQLILVSGEDDWMQMAEDFNRVGRLISHTLEKCADDVCGCMTKYATNSEDSTVSKTVTNIYLQVADANELLQQSLENFIIVLQQLTVKQESDM